MRAFLAVLVLLLAAFGVWWVFFSDAPRHTGVLIVSQGTDAKKLDPIDIDDGDSVRVCVNLFDTLVRFKMSEQIEVEASLALRWKRSDDGYRYVFHLREGVSFHDGTPCDAAAVAFSFKRLLDPEHPSRHGATAPYAPFYEDIADVHPLRDGDEEHALAVVFEMKRDKPPVAQTLFELNLAMFPASIVSPAAVEKHGAQFAEHPVGTGPFRFKSWQRGEALRLDANPSYWDGAPKLSGLVFKPIPDNATRLKALETGEVHWMSGVNPPDMETIAANPRLALGTQPGANVAYLALLTKPDSPFSDLQVRKAVAHAVDKERIAGLYYGIGEIAHSLVPPSVFGAASPANDWQPPRYDVERAKAELAKSEKYAGGFKTTLHVMSEERPYMPQPTKVAQVIRENLAAIGIDAAIEPEKWETYKVRVTKGAFPLALIGWITDNGDPDNFLFPLLGSDESGEPNELNNPKWRHARFNELLRQGQRTGDAEQRRGIYRELQSIAFLGEHPVVPLVHVQQVVALRREVRGFRLHPTGNAYFHQVDLEKNETEP